MANVPFVPGVYESGNNIAELILRAGETAAENRRRQFQGFGDVVSSLGQIPGQIAQQKRLDAQTKLEEARTKREEARASGLEMEAQKLSAQDTAFSELMAQSQGQPDPKSILGIYGPERGGKIIEGLTAAQNLQQKQGQEALAQLPTMVKGLGALSPEMRASFWPHARDLVIKAGLATPEHIPDQPDEKFFEGLVSWANQMAPEKPISIGANDRLVLPSTGKELVAAQPKEMSEYERESLGLKRQELSQKATEQGTAITLSPGALDQAAARYLTDGTLPPMGMGKAGASVRQTILNRAAELDPSADIALNRAGFSTDQSSLRKLKPQVDAVAAFERTVAKNAEILEESLQKLPDTGTKFLNRPWRALQGQLGSEEMAKFDTIRQSVQNEYARLISNPNLSGTMSDSARKEAEALLSPNATVGQMRAALATLKREAANRHSAYQDQIGEIEGRMKGRNKPDATAPAALPTSAPKQVTTKAEFDALPSGAEFIAPDGSHRRKP